MSLLPRVLFPNIHIWCSKDSKMKKALFEIKLIQLNDDFVQFNQYAAHLTSINRFGFKIGEPNGGRQRRHGARAASWRSMDCMELWYDMLFRFRIAS